MARSRHRRSVALPWEARGSLFDGAFTGNRWRGVLVLAAIVLGVAWVGRVADRHEKTRATRAAIAEVRRAVVMFRADVGRCPRSAVELVHPPNTQVRYLAELPNDAWGRALYVRCPGHLGEEHVDVISAGPDGDFFSDSIVQ